MKMGLLEKAKELKKSERQMTLHEDSKKEERQPGLFETELDKMFTLIQRQGKITLKELARYFDIPIARVEHYAKILENNALVQLHYPAFGSTFLTIKAKGK